MLASVVMALAATSSVAAEDYFDGAYIGVNNLGFEGFGGPNFGYSAGVANYYFLTDGYYNTAAG